MLVVGHMTEAADVVRSIRAAFPGTVLSRVTLEQATELAGGNQLHTLVVDETVVAPRALALLAILKARHPELLLLARLPADPELPRREFVLCQAGVDGVLIAGMEECSNRLRDVLRLAAISTVVRMIERFAAPLPPELATPSLEGVLERITALKHAKALAMVLGLGLPALRRALREVRLLPAKTLLAYFRLLAAARLLTDSEESAERVGLNLGYGSAPAFRSAAKKLLGAPPAEVRARGGLRFAGERFREAVEQWRCARRGQATTSGALASGRRAIKTSAQSAMPADRPERDRRGNEREAVTSIARVGSI